jgi:hypothetical protein
LATYDEDSILLEKPYLIEGEEKTQDKIASETVNISDNSENIFHLSKSKVITAFAMINYTFSTVPHDELLFQYVSTSLRTLLDSS